MPRKTQAFTLVELLVVIAIIGVLAGIILPVVLSQIRTASVVQCTTNLHQLFTAMQNYSNEHGGRLPFAGKDRKPHEHLQLLIDEGFITEPELFRCRADAFNPGIPEEDIDADCRFKLTSETCSYTMNKRPLSFNDRNMRQVILCDKDPVNSHGGGGVTYLYLNGSVQHVHWKAGEKKVLPKSMYRYSLDEGNEDSTDQSFFEDDER